MRKRLFKFGIGVVMTGALTSLGIVVRDVTLEERALAELQRVAKTPRGLPGLLKEVPLLLLASDGKLQLYDAPGGQLVSFSLPADTLIPVRVIKVLKVKGQPWFLMELVEGEGRGWIPSATLTLHLTPSVSFGEFQFCQGNQAGPSGPCGSSLALPMDGLWLTWHYQGLKSGDMLQRVLIINGERYQSTPTPWAGPRTGQQLVDLLGEHQPRVEAGLWTVQFLVNGEMVSETSLHLRDASLTLLDGD